MMKRRRKVILIACSLAVLALFVGIAWLKANGDFYPLDRSGMMLSPVETARWLFSDDVENGVMLISATFPKVPDTRSLTQSEALQILRRTSSKWECVFWADVNGIGAIGILIESKLGEITFYQENLGFTFNVFEDKGSYQTYDYPERFVFPVTEIMALPEGSQFFKLGFRPEEESARVGCTFLLQIARFPQCKREYRVSVSAGIWCRRKWGQRYSHLFRFCISIMENERMERRVAFHEVESIHCWRRIKLIKCLI